MIQTHLTNADARKQNLPGCDVFIYSHLIYIDDGIHRDIAVVNLNREAYKAFLDTIFIKHREQLQKEAQETQNWLDQGGHQSGLSFPFGQTKFYQIEFINYENLKFACAFELHLKARLLAQNFIIHEIDSSINNDYKILAKEQRERPIKKSEIFELDGYRFDGKNNYLPGIKKSSIKFSLLTEKPNYFNELGLPKNTIDVINDYRELRNQIHFPGDVQDSKNLQKYLGDSLKTLIINFINMEIVIPSNKLAEKHNFNGLKMPEILS